MVHGSLSPKYLLKGILGDRFPNTIINIPTRSMTKTLFSSVIAISFLDDNREIIKVSKRTPKESRFKNLKVLTFGFPFERFTISPALLFSIKEERRAKIPIINRPMFSLENIKLVRRINKDKVNSMVFVTSSLFISFPSLIL